MTTTTPTTTAPSSTTHSFRKADATTRRRRWLAIAAGAVVLAGASVAVVAFDGSDTDRPAVESVVPAGATDVRGPVSADAAERHAANETAVDGGVRGPVSADAAERHAASAATSSCSGLQADAAERCLMMRER